MAAGLVLHCWSVMELVPGEPLAGFLPKKLRKPKGSQLFHLLVVEILEVIIRYNFYSIYFT